MNTPETPLVNIAKIPKLSDIEKGIDLAKPGADLTVRLLIARMVRDIIDPSLGDLYSRATNWNRGRVDCPPLESEPTLAALKGRSPDIDIDGCLLIEPLPPEMARQMELVRIAVDKVLGVIDVTRRLDAGTQKAAATLREELKENHVFSFEIIQSAQGEKPQAQLTRIERNLRSPHSRVLLHHLNGARGDKNAEFVTWRRYSTRSNTYSLLAPSFVGDSHVAKHRFIKIPKNKCPTHANLNDTVSAIDFRLK